MSAPEPQHLQEEHDSNTSHPMTANDVIPEQSQSPLPKPRGTKRLLHGLQRMSSSQSLLRLHRTPSSGYRGIGRGSISCISLSSSSASYAYPLGSSDGSQFSQGFSTAPTSIPSTPGGADTPFSDDNRIRFIRDGKVSTARTLLSVGLPADARIVRPATSAGAQITEEDYFSCVPSSPKLAPRRPSFDFWTRLPSELKTDILRHLEAREIVRCSRVSKAWHRMCFDGHLWANLDISPFYQNIPADALVNIITKAGPFARDLNLRGCVQLWDRWRATCLANVCCNLESLSLEGCRIDRSAVHALLYQNKGLVQINVSGLGPITNTSLKIIAQHCPRLQQLNVSWCSNIDAKGLKHVIDCCPDIRDLRASEVRGFGDVGIMNELFKKNTLERLVLVNCETLTEEAFSAFFEGIEPEKDYLTGRSVVPARRLKHLDIARCRSITDDAIMSMIANAPDLEGLQLSKCGAITDGSLTELLPTLPSLTHLDLEELDQITNATLQKLSRSPCKSRLRHLSISYCENLGDVGMLPVIKHCTSLNNLVLDNTRISDLVLIEAAAAVRARPPVPNSSTSTGCTIPKIALSMVVYDCQNVTWTGIREILSRNAEACNNPRGYPLPQTSTAIAPESGAATDIVNLASIDPVPSPLARAPSVLLDAASPAPPVAHIYPWQIITLKVFYGYQPTVTEHTRRCQRGDFAAAARLERKWAEYMVASEEAGAPGGFGPGGFGLFTGVAGRRRRRRIREAAMMHADEEDEGGFSVGGGVGRRRRARSGGSCAVM